MKVISIITVVYNNFRTIEHAINSVIKQSYENIEYIIIDGGSIDGTLEIIKNYQSNITRVISEPDQGLYDAMNKGLSLATGDVVGILNSDDFYTSEDVIRKVVDGFASSNCDILYGDVNYVERDQPDQIVRKWISGEYVENYFEKGFAPAHPTVFIKREFADEFKYNLKYKLAADYDWLLRLFKKPDIKVRYLPLEMINMRLGGATSKNWKNILRGNFEIAQSWWENEGKIPLLTLFYYRPKIKLKQFV